MEEKELKKFIENADQNLKDLTEAIEKKADAEAIEGLKEELTETIDKALTVGDKNLTEYVKEIQEHTNGLEQRITEIIQGAAKNAEHPEVTLDKFLNSDEWKDSIKMYKSGGKPSAKALDLNTKVLTVGSDLTAGNNPVILPEREAGVSALPRADTPIYNLVQKGTTMKDKISWIERTIASESQGTVAQGENLAFGESDALWTEVDVSIKKLTDSFRATNEILEDTEFVRSEIMAMLTYNIPHLRETQLLSGTGATVYMKGLLTSATAWSAPTGSAEVTNANWIDALRAAILQVNLGYNGTDAYTKGYNADSIVMHPTDIFNLKSQKDTNDNYLIPNVFSQAGLAVDGIPIIASTDMTQGSYLVGAIRQVAKYFTRRGLQVKFWDQYDTDPQYDRVMFTASERGALRVTNIGAYGLVTGTFAATMADIEKVAA